MIALPLRPQGDAPLSVLALGAHPDDVEIAAGGTLLSLAERHPGLDLTLVLDCADEAGTALGALRRGIKAIRVTASPEARAKLAALAESYGARLDEDERPCLDLLDSCMEQADLAARCRDWLTT